MAESTGRTQGIIAWAREYGVVPQFMYAQIRENKLVAYTCQCGHLFAYESDVKAWAAKRASKKS